MSTDLEGAQNLLGDNLSVTIRHGFIRKVYSLLFVQLLLTTVVGAASAAGLASLAKSSGGRQTYAMLLIFSTILYIGLIMTVSCFPAYLRKYPLNMGLMAAISVTLGFILGVVTSGYSSNVVLAAAGMTCAITAALTLFACQTKYDITGKASYIWGISVALLCVMFVAFFFPGNSTFQLAVSCLVLVAFSIFLVYDTQIIVGGKHRQFELSIDDYAAGALLLYLDVINIFQALLRILGSNDN